MTQPKADRRLSPAPEQASAGAAGTSRIETHRSKRQRPQRKCVAPSVTPVLNQKCYPCPEPAPSPRTATPFPHRARGWRDAGVPPSGKARITIQPQRGCLDIRFTGDPPGSNPEEIPWGFVPIRNTTLLPASSFPRSDKSRPSPYPGGIAANSQRQAQRNHRFPGTYRVE